MNNKPSPQEPSIDEAMAQAVTENKTTAAENDPDFDPQLDSQPSSRSTNDLEELRMQVREAEGKALRVQADLENFRKRSRRELDENIKYAATPLVRDLLPVIDNLERAIAAEDSATDDNGLRQGVQMVATQLTQTLAQHHCTVITAEGEAFDPMRHEAVMQQHHDNIAAGMVIQVVQTGYQLHDRVIRPAHVIVSQGPTPAPGA